MKGRNGSALLVVLGMLSFMVISGIAFAVFMRTTRMSSSFTRRTVATRQLAKAALAEAIDQIDRAVANDPHPNVRRGTNEKNHWLGRVLLSTGETTGTAASSLASSLSADADADGASGTVPILTLEALAYLPPTLVNEARCYGQKVPSAAWQTFDFDAGRYAYIALDVSDYLDVNRLVADEGRSSNPSRRVTYSYAFDEADHSRWQGGAGQWDSFMDKFRTCAADGTFSFGSKVPLVSLADFNLAFDDQFKSGLSGFKSPFCEYLRNKGGGNGLYNSSPNDGEDSDWFKYAQMTYVTDSLDAPLTESEKKTSAGLEIWDLDDEEYQPFTESFLKQDQSARTLTTVQRQSSRTLDRFLNHGVPQVALSALSDYLDRDRLPISLGIPSVERVPMICGIRSTIAESATAVTLKRDVQEDSTLVSGTEGTDQTITKECTVSWNLDPTTFRTLVGGGAGVNVLAVYPFHNYEKVSEAGWYKMDGKVQIFLSSAPMPLRTGNRGDLLHYGANSTEGRAGGSVASLCDQPKLTDNAVFNFPLKEKDLDSIQYASIAKPEDCVKEVALDLDRSACASFINSSLNGTRGCVLRVTYRWTLTGTPNPNAGQGQPAYIDYKPQLSEFTHGIPELGYANANVMLSPDHAPESELQVLKADGTIDDLVATVTAKPKDNIDLYLNMAVTVRVKSDKDTVLGASSGTKTVDMVPATAYDDEPLNGVINTGSRLVNVGGLSTPLMKFIGSQGTLNAQTSEDVTWSVESSPKAVMIDDPRYNHAPENWFESAGNFSEAGWLAAQSSGSRDGDIFMASSDQNYLQSVYELGCLPRLSDLRQYTDELRGNLGAYDGVNVVKLGAGGRPDANLMWRTYDIFGRYDGGPDGFEELGLENLGRGLRVNPYSDSTNVVMAAFANTPLDWRLASDTDDAKLNPAMGLDAQSFNAKYAWNEYSTGGKIAWPLLSAVAGEFMSEVRTAARNGSGTWKDALLDIFDNETQYDTSDYLCGLDARLAEFKPANGANSQIYSVDKKFLYGFWRNCFAARQQLYLVFFRAEPLALGGGVAGVTPPQLGARGMAVVWRNPNATSGSQNNNGTGSSGYVPHQTRVLFYRQFE